MSQRLLLDTHALIWALSAPRRLPARTARAIRDAENDVYMCAASTWEIALKASFGKIEANVDTRAAGGRAADFDELPITVAHTARLLGLLAHHRDPFDRLLVAQALVERLTIVTHDAGIARYEAPVLSG